MTPLQAKILANVQVTAEGCWLWTLYCDAAGYGRICLPGRTTGGVRVHRVSYEEFVGPIPLGLVIDHLCRTPPCVNPCHLEPVTQRVNTYRGASLIAARRLATHCMRGHEFSPANTIALPRGRRRCRACTYASNRTSGALWRQRQRSAA